MDVFGDYSRYYDLLYRDKDYPAEAAYVARLIREHNPQAKSILDLGCGTGRHDFILAQMGYRVTGVDFAKEMINQAVLRLAELKRSNSSLAQNLEFHHGDIRILDLGRRFDAVISLFHVLSYQVTNTDVERTFLTVSRHLDADGLFLFDFWYGPAVLTDRPAVRVKMLEDERTHITRIAEPAMHARENIVDVNYHIIIQDKNSRKAENLHECHRMRYFSEPELRCFLSRHNLEVIDASEFITGKPLDFNTWNACVSAKSRV